MIGGSWPRVTIACAFLMLTPAWAHQGYQHGAEKKHHTLRGTITQIDPAAQTFAVQTAPHTIVLCYLDSKSIVRRNGKEIRLEDIHNGERVRCKCSEHSGGRHYSLELLVAAPKERKKR